MLPPHLRMYEIMKTFPGLTPPQIDAEPAQFWDWMLGIDTAVNRGAKERKPDEG